MASPQHHLIRRQVLEFDAHGTELEGMALQRQCAGLCHNLLLPALEKMLNRLVPTDEHWLIDHMDIDVDIGSLENLERDLADLVVIAAENQLRECAPAVLRYEQDSAKASVLTSIQRKSAVQSIHDAFVFFLYSGTLPWWFHIPGGQSFEQVVRASWTETGELALMYFRQSIIRALRTAYVRMRLVQQFSAEFLDFMLARLSPECEAHLAPLLKDICFRDPILDEQKNFVRQLWLMIFTGLSEGHTFSANALVAASWNQLSEAERSKSFLADLVSRLGFDVESENDMCPAGRKLAMKDLLGEPSHTLNNFIENINLHKEFGNGEKRGIKNDGNVNGSIDLQEGVYIGCAGLILLHPFLPQFFESVGVAVEGKLMQPERALSLLHFLATGQEAAPEYELLLPKILCNVALARPLEDRFAWDSNEKDEVEALLQAVIRHWDALGETSVMGLRGSFLTRPGKLSRRDNGDDLLQIEERSFDILLDRLPWGISMIQLPWMERILWVEWTK